MKDIFIIGAGGVGRETAQLIEDINRVSSEWHILGFIDDNSTMWGKYINGYEVVGGSEYLSAFDGSAYTVCTISNPRIKKLALSKINNQKIRFANLIHPTALISSSATLGSGLIIQAYCIVSTNVFICDHVQLNPQCGIGHDSIIGDFSSLYWNVNISGNVKVGEGCVLGTKTTVIQGLKVGEWSIVGASATIIDDIPSGCTAVGTPAKPIKFLMENV